MGVANWLKKNIDPEQPSSVKTSVWVMTELVRWLAIVVPIYMAIWRWAYYKGYTIYFNEDNAQVEFWLIATGIFMGGSLVLYLPLKLCCVKHLNIARKEWGWRPSIMQYILLCALPCMTIILYAVQTRLPEFENQLVMDEQTMIALQLTVLGLTFTEWMAKLREEVFTYDLISAMAGDFFFAYDVIDFLMMLYHDTDVFSTNWIYITFGFTFLAMWKYIPTQPTMIFEGKETPKGAVASILVSMICQDIPFVVVRVILLIQYDFRVSDLIHPLKNSALIGFGILQLWIIFRNQRNLRKMERLEFEERRKPRPEGRDRFVTVVQTVTAAQRAKKRQQAAAGGATSTIATVSHGNQNQVRNSDAVELTERQPPTSMYPDIDYS